MGALEPWRTAKNTVSVSEACSGSEHRKKNFIDKKKKKRTGGNEQGQGGHAGGRQGTKTPATRSPNFLNGGAIETYRTASINVWEAFFSNKRQEQE